MGKAEGPIEFASDREPWERQPGETDRQFARFAHYLEMGRVRTLRQLGENLRSMGESVGNNWLYQVAARWRWADRARAHDNEQDRLYFARVAKKREDMAERHAKLASAVLGVASRALKALSDHLTANPNAGVVAPADLVKLVDLGTRLERMALGEPGQTVAVTGGDGGPVGTIDYSGLTDAQRRERMAELAAEAARRAGVALTDHDDDE